MQQARIVFVFRPVHRILLVATRQSAKRISEQSYADMSGRRFENGSKIMISG